MSIQNIRNNIASARSKASRVRNGTTDADLQALAKAVADLADCVKDLAAEVNRLKSQV